MSAVVVEFSSPLFSYVRKSDCPSDEDDSVLNCIMTPVFWSLIIKEVTFLGDLKDHRLCYTKDQNVHPSDKFDLVLVTPNKPLKLFVCDERDTTKPNKVFEDKPSDCDGMIFDEETFPIVYIDKSADVTLTKLPNDYGKLYTFSRYSC